MRKSTRIGAESSPSESLNEPTDDPFRVILGRLYHNDPAEKEKFFSLTVSSPVDLQRLLEKLVELKSTGNTRGKALRMLSFEYTYEDYPPELEFVGTRQASDGSVLNSHLSEVVALEFRCCKFACFLQIELPVCTSLRFDQSAGCKGGGPQFDAPMLDGISFKWCRYDNDRSVSRFLTNSLNKSPRLEELYSYKWIIHTLGPLYLPSATYLSFWRSDCLQSLTLYAPRLKKLNLQACYSIEHIKLLKRGLAAHKEFNVTKQANFSKFKLNLVNTGEPPKQTRVEWANWPQLREVYWGHDASGHSDFDDSKSDDSGEWWDYSSSEEDASPPPLELVTVGGISDFERKERARWIQSYDYENLPGYWD